MKIHHKKPLLACKEGEYNSLQNCELIMSEEEEQRISNAIRTNKPTDFIEGIACDIARFWLNCYLVGSKNAKEMFDKDFEKTCIKYIGQEMYKKIKEDN